MISEEAIIDVLGEIAHQLTEANNLKRQEMQKCRNLAIECLPETASILLALVREKIMEVDDAGATVGSDLIEIEHHLIILVEGE